MIREIHFSAQAERDLDAILDWSFHHFGELLTRRYAALIYHCLELIKVEPFDGSDSTVSATSAVRIFHLRNGTSSFVRSAGKVKHPRHLIVYRALSPDQIEIARLVHERMDLQRHLPDDLQPDPSDVK